MLQLSRGECSALLALGHVGRIAFVVDGEPLVLPVNYRWLDDGVHAVIAVRTRPGNVLDRALPVVAFEVDGIDEVHQAGWSVLARGTLRHLDGPPLDAELVDPHPWLDDRGSWLILEVVQLSGRRLLAVETQWAFDIRGYL